MTALRSANQTAILDATPSNLSDTELTMLGSVCCKIDICSRIGGVLHYTHKCKDGDTTFLPRTGIGWW